MGGALSASTSSTCEALVATIVIIFVIIILSIVIIIARSHFGSSMAQWVQSSPREGLFRALHIEIPPGILRPLFERPVNDLAVYLDQLANNFDLGLLYAVLGRCHILPADRYLAVLEWSFAFFDGDRGAGHD